MGSTTPLHPELHRLRGHAGQIRAATALRRLLEGAHMASDKVRVQDPYCLRCQPQVVGACLDLLTVAGKTLTIEANAATDNPLILGNGSAVSGGNFHAEPVAFAADQMALAVSELGALSQRRIALLVDPGLSHGLPAFVSRQPGLHSGFMAAEVTAAALMSENRHMAAPVSVDSTPMSANFEDHVSMACHAARRLLDMTHNLCGILAIEALVAVQGIGLRLRESHGEVEVGPELQKAVAAVRAVVPALEGDRYMAPDLEAVTALVASGGLVDVIADGVLPELELGPVCAD